MPPQAAADPSGVPAAWAPRALRRPLAGRVADRGYLLVAAVSALVAVVLVGYLIHKTAEQTGPAWDTFGAWGFITGTEWVVSPDEGEPVFGAMPFIHGTLMTSTIAMVIAVPLAVGVALATTVFLPRRLRGPLAGVLEPPFGLLSGPVLSGSYLMAGLVLAIMVLAIITAITREVLATVPREQQEAAYALGATRWEMVRDSMLPWARSGIVGASARGLGRAMGETIALALVLGNVPSVWGSLLGPGSTAAGVIASETGESGDLQLAALTALALVLFLLTFLVNGVARLLVRRSAALPTVSRDRRIRSLAAEGLVYLCIALGFVPLVLLLGEIVVSGAQTLSWDFLAEVQPVDPNAVAGYGVGNALVGTLMMSGLATLMAAPLGILTALFISELGATWGWPRRIADAVGFFVDVLLGMPSIVAGLTVTWASSS